MTKFFGNCNNLIDWNSVLEPLDTAPPTYTGPRHQSTDNIEGVSEVSALWIQSGYKPISQGGSVGWDMFYPGQQFDHDVVDKFAKFVNFETVLECWISRILPGKMAPWHWDTNDRNEEYDSIDKLVRFSCHISNPTPGHVFTIEEVCLYNQPQGNVYQWPSRRSYHAGANFGLTPKYLFNIFGIVK